MTTTTGPRPTSPIVIRLLKLRDNDTGARVALRRGNSDATAHYAYPYLAHLWTSDGDRWKREPLLRFAALLASSPKVADNHTVSLGRFLRLTALARADPGPDATDRAIDRVGQRILAVQTGDVATLDQTLRGLIPTSAATGGISWQSVHDTYLYWDQLDLQRRQRTRRRLLEDFYTPIPTTNQTDRD